MPHDHVLALNLSDDTTKWVALCGAVLLVIYIVLRASKKRRRDPLDRPPVQSTLSQQRSVERQMSNLLVELSEMARQITAQLDTRAAKLEALMREADEKIATLQTMQNGNGTPAGPAPSASRGFSDPSLVMGASRTPAASEDDPRHVEVYALADQGLSAADIARKLSRPNGEIELILALRSRA